MSQNNRMYSSATFGLQQEVTQNRIWGALKQPSNSWGMMSWLSVIVIDFLTV